MSFVTEIMNPFLVVRNKIKNSQGQWVDVKKEKQEQYQQLERYEMQPGDEQVVFERWGKKIIIDAITYSTTSYETIYPRLFAREGSGIRTADNLFITLGRDGLSWDPSIPYLRHEGNDFLELRYDNAENNDYVVGLRKPIILPEGGKLVIVSNSNYRSDEHALTLSVYYRVFEEE